MEKLYCCMSLLHLGHQLTVRNSTKIYEKPARIITPNKRAIMSWRHVSI